MKEWEPLILAVAVVIIVVRAVYDVGGVLGKRLDELHEKVDALQEKVEEIESNQDKKPYVNPIDL
jgi:uncharacterized protein YoxC